MMNPSTSHGLGGTLEEKTRSILGWKQQPGGKATRKHSLPPLSPYSRLPLSPSSSSAPPSPLPLERLRELLPPSGQGPPLSFQLLLKTVMGALDLESDFRPPTNKVPPILEWEVSVVPEDLAECDVSAFASLVQPTQS